MQFVKLKKQLDWILNVGIQPNLASEQIERIKVINGFCLISALFILIVSVINLMTGFSLKVIYHVIFLSIVHFPILYFQYKHKYLFASLYFTACSLIYIHFISIVAFQEGRFTETENIIFVHLAIILLIFDAKFKSILYSISLGSLLILKAVKFHYLGQSLDREYAYTVINILFIAFSLYLYILVFKRALIKSKETIASLNDVLIAQNAEIVAQNEEIIAQYDTLKTHESHIEKSKEILRNTIDNLPLFVAMIDKEGNYVVANQIYGEKFQKTMDEIEGHHYSEVLTEELLKEHINLIARGLKGERIKFEGSTHYPNGTKQYSVGEYIPIYNKESSVDFLLVYVTDISSLKAIEYELIEINQSKNKLFSIIAHDLRSPLNTLTGLLELVNNQLVNEQEFKGLVDELSKNVSYTSQLLNNLLHWASNQMERQVVNPQYINIHQLIENNIILANKNAILKRISLEYKKENDYQVWADKDMIDLVLRNLISNAIKFTLVGGLIRLDTVMRENNVLVSVQDNGIGMSAQALDNLFKYQMHSTNGTNGEKGSGLGLILCKEFVEKNGGRIEVVSEPNKGTTFTFTIPCFEVATNIELA